MTDADRLALRRSVMLHEGLRLKPYHDTTGHLTIGYGRNLASVGISTTEAETLLQADLARAEADCRQSFAWFPEVDPVRQGVLIEMAFNLGIAGLRGFGQTLKAVKEHRYADAAAQMLTSRWATQVKGRAQTLARRMRTGVW